MTITKPTPEIPRDRYGRPMVTPAGGGKQIAYTRCTTFIDVLEDKYNLQKWMQRMVALGLASRPDLVLSVNAHRDDKAHLDRVCEDAREAAGASNAATDGTSLHALTEIIDRGGNLPDGLPDNIKASLNAYAEATKDLRCVHIEQFCVLDTLKVGGTPDRVVAYKGKRYIADLKTGSIEWGALKIAMQLAVYARSWVYDIATGERSRHDADLTKGLIIHLPVVADPADAVCTLHWVDLVEGWRAVILARQVRAKRSLKFRDLTTPYAGSLEFAVPEPAAGPSLLEQIAGCATADDVRALWAANAAAWSDDLTAAAKAHIESLPAAS